VALRRLSGFDTALRLLAGAFSERSLRLVHMASYVQVGPTQYPSLHAIVQDGTAVLDLHQAPDVFVCQDPSVNATTIGMDTPWIVITTGALDLFDEEELRFVVGHELGHVLSGHAVYRTLLHHLLSLARASRGSRSPGWGCAPSCSPWRSGSARPSCPATGPACSWARTSTRPCGPT
jgi:Zn-dependent protease with chaperone function